MSPRLLAASVSPALRLKEGATTLSLWVSGVVALLFRLICSKRNLSFVYYGTKREVSGVSVFGFESFILYCV